MNIFSDILSDNTNLWLLGAAGVCLAWFIPHRLSLSREENIAFRNASAKFRSAILTELGRLYPIATNWPQNEDAFFKAAFLNLQTAVTEFRHFIPWYRRKAFDNAWLCYYSAYPEQTKEQIYHHYMAFQDDGENARQAQERRNNIFHANVSKLLSFASNK